MKKLFFCKKSSTIPTILETSSNPLTAGTFKDNFPFPKVGYVSSLEAIQYEPPHPISFHLKSTSLSQLGVVFNAFETFYGKNFLGFWSLVAYCLHRRKSTGGSQKWRFGSNAFPLPFGLFDQGAEKDSWDFNHLRGPKKWMENNQSFPWGSMAWTIYPRVN